LLRQRTPLRPTRSKAELRREAEKAFKQFKQKPAADGSDADG
jgi:hypothetical protein